MEEIEYLDEDEDLIRGLVSDNCGEIRSQKTEIFEQDDGQHSFEDERDLEADLFNILTADEESDSKETPQQKRDIFGYSSKHQQSKSVKRSSTHDKPIEKVSVANQLTHSQSRKHETHSIFGELSHLKTSGNKSLKTPTSREEALAMLKAKVQNGPPKPIAMKKSTSESAKPRSVTLVADGEKKSCILERRLKDKNTRTNIVASASKITQKVSQSDSQMTMPAGKSLQIASITAPSPISRVDVNRSREIALKLEKYKEQDKHKQYTTFKVGDTYITKKPSPIEILDQVIIKQKSSSTSTTSSQKASSSAKHNSSLTIQEKVARIKERLSSVKGTETVLKQQAIKSKKEPENAKAGEKKSQSKTFKAEGEFDFGDSSERSEDYDDVDLEEDEDESEIDTDDSYVSAKQKKSETSKKPLISQAKVDEIVRQALLARCSKSKQQKNSKKHEENESKQNEVLADKKFLQTPIPKPIELKPQLKTRISSEPLGRLKINENITIRKRAPLDDSVRAELGPKSKLKKDQKIVQSTSNDKSNVEYPKMSHKTTQEKADSTESQNFERNTLVSKEDKVSKTIEKVHDRSKKSDLLSASMRSKISDTSSTILKQLEKPTRKRGSGKQRNLNRSSRLVPIKDEPSVDSLRTASKRRASVGPSSKRENSTDSEHFLSPLKRARSEASLNKLECNEGKQKSSRSLGKVKPDLIIMTRRQRERQQCLELPLNEPVVVATQKKADDERKPLELRRLKHNLAFTGESDASDMAYSLTGRRRKKPIPHENDITFFIQGKEKSFKAEQPLESKNESNVVIKKCRVINLNESLVDEFVRAKAQNRVTCRIRKDSIHNVKAISASVEAASKTVNDKISNLIKPKMKTSTPLANVTIQHVTSQNSVVGNYSADVCAKIKSNPEIIIQRIGRPLKRTYNEKKEHRDPLEISHQIIITPSSNQKGTSTNVSKEVVTNAVGLQKKQQVDGVSTSNVKPVLTAPNRTRYRVEHEHDFIPPHNVTLNLPEFLLVDTKLVLRTHQVMKDGNTTKLPSQQVSSADKQEVWTGPGPIREKKKIRQSPYHPTMHALPSKSPVMNNSSIGQPVKLLSMVENEQIGKILLECESLVNNKINREVQAQLQRISKGFSWHQYIEERERRAVAQRQERQEALNLDLVSANNFLRCLKMLMNYDESDGSTESDSNKVPSHNLQSSVIIPDDNQTVATSANTQPSSNLNSGKSISPTDIGFKKIRIPLRNPVKQHEHTVPKIHSVYGAKPSVTKKKQSIDNNLLKSSAGVVRLPIVSLTPISLSQLRNADPIPAARRLSRGHREDVIDSKVNISKKPIRKRLSSKKKITDVETLTISPADEGLAASAPSTADFSKNSRVAEVLSATQTESEKPTQTEPVTSSSSSPPATIDEIKNNPICAAKKADLSSRNVQSNSCENDSFDCPEKLATEAITTTTDADEHPDVEELLKILEDNTTPTSAIVEPAVEWPHVSQEAAKVSEIDLAQNNKEMSAFADLQETANVDMLENTGSEYVSDSLLKQQNDGKGVANKGLEIEMPSETKLSERGSDKKLGESLKEQCSQNEKIDADAKEKGSAEKFEKTAVHDQVRKKTNANTTEPMENGPENEKSEEKDAKKYNKINITGELKESEEVPVPDLAKINGVSAKAIKTSLSQDESNETTTKNEGERVEKEPSTINRFVLDIGADLESISSSEDDVETSERFNLNDWEAICDNSSQNLYIEDFFGQSGQQFKCLQCKVSTSTEELIKKHTDFHRGKSRVCDICSYILKEGITPDEHLRTDHSNVSF